MLVLKGDGKMYNDLELYNLIGDNIKKRRKSLGITQEKLAALTNYSLSFIANIESRTYQTFSISALNSIAKTLDTTMNNLLPEEINFSKQENKITCKYCNYDALLPIEINKLIENIEEITRRKIKFTCPVCHKKIV